MRRFDSAVEWVIRYWGAMALTVLIICLSPLAIVWMWLDFARLKKVALEIEPMRPNEKEPNLIGRAILFLALPIVVLVGLCLTLFSDDDDDVIW
jgi:hypothetical protein